jgi:hypothetical protein
MEKDLTTRYVAIVEKCAMTEVALRHILINESGKNYRIQFFKDMMALKRSFRRKIFLRLFFHFQVTADPDLKACSFSMRSRVIVPKRKELS